MPSVPVTVPGAPPGTTGADLVTASYLGRCDGTSRGGVVPDQVEAARHRRRRRRALERGCPDLGTGFTPLTLAQPTDTSYTLARHLRSGTYEFRSRVVAQATGAHSLWSPVASLVQP